MSSQFRIQEHVLDCQHIREYARATANSQEEVLKLSIKQYTPLDNPNPRDGDITIIGAHANGFPKELYEPLWDDLLARAQSHGFRIRNIWIADMACQGASGVLNEQSLGNDPSWTDHARDLLHMVNHFRAQMPMPIVGIGHSLGGNILANLSLLHPRLLSTIVLMDPIIQTHATAPSGPNPAQASAYRRDFWPSRAEAEASFKKQKFYQSWDPRVLDKWCKYGIRDTPSLLYPDPGATLRTTKHQECFSFLRESWNAFAEDGKSLINPDLVPDLPRGSALIYPFYRPEGPNTLSRLPEIRPSVLYIFGGTSPMSAPDARKVKMDTTGTGVSGSGGAKVGRVKEVVLHQVGHLVAMEAASKCADAAADWLSQEMKRQQKERDAYIEWTKKSLLEKQTLSEEWKQRIGGPLRPPKGRPSKI